jgi:hypothetical protein
MFLKNLFPPKSYKPIVVLGEGRSGTTWLSQIIAAAGYELNFEPMGHLNFTKKHNFNCDPIPYHYYLRKEKKILTKNIQTLLWVVKLKTPLQ